MLGQLQRRPTYDGKVNCILYIYSGWQECTQCPAAYSSRNSAVVEYNLTYKESKYKKQIF